MNGNIVKTIGLLGIGGVVGGVVGLFLANLIIEELYRKQLDMILEEDTEEVEEEEEEGPQPSKKALDYTKYAKAELSDLVKPYTSSIVEGAKKEVGETKSDRIMIISYDEYQGDRSHNKEPITYYENDTTFANANEDIIDSPTSIFGPNIHLHFGEGNDDPDIVYVRNENNGVDYEIARVHNSYSVIVMGMPEEPPKEKAKRRKNVRKVDTHDEENEEEYPEG